MRLLIASLLLALALTACTLPGIAAPESPQASFRPVPPALAAAGADVLERPVLGRNFPDPGAIEVDGVFYAFATNANRANIQAARSDNLIDWTLLPDALPQLAPWAQPLPGMVWAPEVTKAGAGFNMYYVAHDRASGVQCIGVATSPGPAGPYLDTSGQPLVCPAGFQRAIDPSPYSDGRDLYLYFSAVCCGQPNGIYVQKLAPGGLATAGAPRLLISVDAAWEGSVVEAPSIVKYRSRYYLFYSGNDYRNASYAVGYAVCKTAAGPCSKARENPILSTGSTGSAAAGPGHQYVIQVGGGYWMLFHGWDGIVGNQNGGQRALWLQPLNWSKGRPIVGSGSVDAAVKQP
jgi:beta-xylosidase